MDCSLPGSSVHGNSQARILEWAAISFSRDLPDPQDRLTSPAFQADSLPVNHRESSTLDSVEKLKNMREHDGDRGMKEIPLLLGQRY